MASKDNKRIAKNTLFLYVRMLVVLGISLYTTRAVLHILGVVDYGIYNIVCGFVSMFAFLNNSLANGVQRFYNFKKGKGSTSELADVYSASLTILLIVSLIVFVLLETFGVWYINNKMVIPSERMYAAFWIFQFSVISLVFIILSVPYSAAILAFEKMDYYAVVSIIDALLKLIVVLVLADVNYDRLIFYGALILFVSVINFAMYYVYSKRYFRTELHFCRIKDWSLFKEISTFSGWNVFGTFAYMIKDQGLNVLLNAFFGPVVNAAKGIAMQVNSALQGFSTNIVAAVRPQLVQSYSKGEISRVQTLMFSMSRLIFVMLFVLSLPIMMELKYILQMWLSDKVPEYTVIFTDLVLVNMIVSSMNTPLSQVVHATGKMKAYQVATSLVICSILPNAWGFLKMGMSPTSTFVVSIVVSIVNQVVCLFLLRRIFPFSIKAYNTKIVLPCLLLLMLSLITPISIRYLLQEGLVRLFINTLFTIMITILLSYFVVFTKEEKLLVNGIILKIKKRK